MSRVNVYTTDDITGEKTLQGWFDTASLVEEIDEATYWDGNNSRGVISGLQLGNEQLLRTSGGRWITRYDGRREYNGPLTFTFITDAQAREWLLRCEFDDIVEKYFGEVEEERGPGGRPEVGNAVHIRLGELLARVDLAAARQGKTRAAFIRTLIEDALNAMAYTVEIQAGEGVWQALAPAGAIDAQDAEEAARLTADNQNLVDPYDSGPWRIAVWAGTDTSGDPAYVLDGQTWLDGQADIADRADAARAL